MDEMRELYQEVILDHHKHPRNFGRLDAANRHADGFNPLCGDRITVYAVIEGDVIRDLAFEGSGCAICVASASVMTDELKGHTVAEAEKRFGEFHALVTGDPSSPAASSDEMGKLAVFVGVREFPVRIKCATLPWHALHAALAARGAAPVSTE